MPSLSASTSPNVALPPSRSRSQSPIRPPYSPITPTISSARLATTTPPSNASQTRPTSTYTHAQPPQTSIPQPTPIPFTTVTYEENPDVLALKSAASILQIQARNAVKDIQALQRIKERALRDPAAFGQALESGVVRTRADPLYKPGEFESEEEDDGDGDVEMGGGKGNGNGKEGKGEKVRKEGKREGPGEKWETLPAPQNIVRCPPVNWNQYAVVGDSLDKIHKDQLERPSEGVPMKVGSDGQLISGGEGARRQHDLGVAAPYQPGRDKIEKMSTRRGGKR
jgi:hypothetical protein